MVQEPFYEDKIHFSDLGNVLAAQGILGEIKKYIVDSSERYTV